MAMEQQALLDGLVIGQLATFSVVPYLRAGRLVPVLVGHVTAHLSVHLFYGSRRAQPARVRQFIEFALHWLTDNPEHVLSGDEIAAMARRQRPGR